MVAKVEVPSLAGPMRTGTRRRAAVISVGFSYTMIVVAIVKNIVLVPMYLHYFDLSTYGAWLATGNVVGLLGLLDGGLGVVFGQRLSYSWGRCDREQFGRVTAAGLLLYTGITVVMLIAGIGVAGRLPGFVQAPADQSTALSLATRLAVVGAAATLLQANVLALLSAWQRPAFAGASRVGTQVIELAVIIVALRAGAGVVSLGLGAAISGALGLMSAWTYVGASWRRAGLGAIRCNAGDVRSLLRATMPLIFGKIAGVLIGNSEAAVVAAVIDPRAAAIVTISVRVLRVAESFVNPIAGASFAGLAHLVGSDERLRSGGVIRDVISISGALAAAAIPCAFVIDAPFVGLWVGEDKFVGTRIAAVFALASFLVVRANLVTTLLSAVGEIAAVAWFGIIDAAMRLGLLYVFVRWWGTWGVPLAAVVSMGLVTIVFYAHRIVSVVRLAAWGVVQVAFGGLPTAVLSALLGLCVGELDGLYASRGWSGFVVRAIPVVGVSAGVVLLLHWRVARLGVSIVTRAVGRAARPSERA